MEKSIENIIAKCKMCGRELGQFVGIMNDEPYIVCSSDYIENWPYCKSCMIEHCVITNCLGCEFNPGNYNNCRFLETKTYYLKEDM